MKSYDMTVYRERAKSYGAKMSRGNGGQAIAELPVEVWTGRYMPLSDIKSPADLPNIPERMRDFAIRTVLEGYKPDREWAKLFGVASFTIGRWRRDERVAKVRGYMLNERRGYLLAQTVRLEKTWWSKIDQLLNVKITGETAPVVLQTLKFVHSLLSGEPPKAGGTTLGTFNISVGMGPGGGLQSGPSPFREERDVTPEDIKKLQAELHRERDFIQHYVDMQKNMITTGGNGDGSGSREK